MSFSKRSIQIFLLAVLALSAEILAIYYLVPSQIISASAGQRIAVLAILTAAIGAAALFFGVLFPPIARVAFSNWMTEDQRSYLLQFKMWRVILEIKNTDPDK